MSCGDVRRVGELLGCMTWSEEEGKFGDEITKVELSCADLARPAIDRLTGLLFVVGRLRSARDERTQPITLTRG